MPRNSASTLEHRPRLATSQGEAVAVDLEDVVDQLVEYVRTRTHAAGARAWADSLTPDHVDYRLARVRSIEASDVAAAQLHGLALALFPDLDDVLAHEQFVDDVDDAIKAGWLAGFDGQAATAHGFDDDDDEVECVDCLALGAELCDRCAALVYAAAGVEPPAPDVDIDGTQLIEVVDVRGDLL